MPRRPSSIGLLFLSRIGAVLLAVCSSAALAQNTVTLEMGDDTASEAGSDTAEFTITRTGPTGTPLNVFLDGSGSSVWGTDWNASGGDFFAFTVSSFRVVIPGGATSVTVTLTPEPDNRLEGQEDFSFTIRADAAYQVGNPAGDSFTLEDDVAEVTLEMTDDMAAEAGPDSAQLVVRRSANGLLSAPLTVRLSGSGAATWGQDWTADGGSFFVFSVQSFRVVIPANELSATVTITPQADNRVEGLEDFTFSVSPPTEALSGYTIGAGASDGFTLEDDVAVVTIEMTQTEAREFGEVPATLVVRRSANGLTTDPLTVRLAGSGTATWGQDWNASGGDFFALSVTSFRAVIPADQLSATITITPIQEPVDEEDDEAFTFTVSAPSSPTSAYVIGDPDEASFTIGNYGPLVFKDGLEPP